jgi:hypothetical protein
MSLQHRFSMLVAWSIIAALSACRHPDLRTTEDGKYGEWLSMSPSARESYVEGFTAGYSMGSITACNNADRLFPTNPPLFDKAGNLQMPTLRCLEVRDHYSRISQDHASHYRSYTGAVTEFYEKFPKYRRIPYAYLLRYLSDKQYGSADQLCQAFDRGEIQGTF